MKNTKRGDQYIRERAQQNILDTGSNEKLLNCLTRELC